MVRAVIFDLDGLLLDSEAYWQQAEYEMFSSLGVPLQPQDTAKTLGWRCDNVVRFWYQQFPWTGPTQSEVADALITRVIHLIAQHGCLMPGALQALQRCQQLQLPTALATSSHHRLMLAALEHFELLPYFQATCSAEFLPYAKPHPQVYLNAAAALGVEPMHCVALEDSVTGLIAAKAAQMRCIVVPDAKHRHDPRYGIADQCLNSLTELTAEDLLR